MSDDSESVTVLADIPANCGMYTAQEVRDYVSGAISDYDSDVTGGCGVAVAIGMLQSRVACGVEPALFELSGVVDNRILPVSGDSSPLESGKAALILSSGVDGLEAIYFNKRIGTSSQAWDRVMLESDFESEQLACGMTNVQFMQAIAKGVWCGIGSRWQSYGPIDGVTGAFDEAHDGFLAYETLTSNFSLSPDKLRTTSQFLSGLISATVDDYSLSGDINMGRLLELSGLLNDLYNGGKLITSGNICNYVSGCIGERLAQIESGLSGVENCCSNIGDISDALADLTCGLAGLNSAISGITLALSGIAAEVSGLPAAIVAAIDAAADEPDASPAMVRAAAKIADVAPQEVHNMNADINAEVTNLSNALDGVADAAEEVADALDEVADATDGSTSETASEASSGASEVAETASAESTGVGAITFFP